MLPAHSLHSIVAPSLDALRTNDPDWLDQGPPYTFYRPGENLSILVVDDDDVDLERTCRFLKRLEIPFEVCSARSGADALRLVKDNKFDILLLDFRLGDMTGIEVLSSLEELKHSPIPTIMITGMGDEKTAIDAMKHGVHDYLPKKGLTPETLMSAIASALHAAILESQLREAEENLRRLSLYDTLTGLPNRNLFFDRLNQSINSASRNDSSFVILMIDLNMFKEVNDSHGHKTGDDVLGVIGDRLQSVSRKSDTFARLGGDEFASILHDIDSLDTAINCVEKISDYISKPIVIDGKVMHVGASIGIAKFPDHGVDQTSLISNADYAMYRAKRNSRKYEVYTSDDEEQHPKIPLTLYLHQAIRDKELYLEYQPKINLLTNEVVGVEALVRWSSPEFGMVMPNHFIPMAERSDLILEITYQIIELACHQFKQWQEKGIVIPLALNISARILDDKNFADWISSRLDYYDISPENITLEITETTLASSSRSAYILLDKFNEIGMDISIDDFGSGFTSFTSIRNVEIAELKIDRMYVNKLQAGSKDSAIIHSMVSLAESLGIRVIAEGVETSEQWEQLLRLGCHFAQGYGIARPMSANALVNWIETLPPAGDTN